MQCQGNANAVPRQCQGYAKAYQGNAKAVPRHVLYKEVNLGTFIEHKENTKFYPFYPAKRAIYRFVDKQKYFTFFCNQKRIKLQKNREVIHFNFRPEKP